jgi:hypothetical protein
VNYRMLFASAVAASLVTPLAARAQGVPDGVVHGASVGNHTAGPIGAVVGGAVGGVIGGFEGALGIHPVAYPQEPRPAYRYHRRWRRHAYRNVRHKPAPG